MKNLPKSQLSPTAQDNLDYHGQGRNSSIPSWVYLCFCNRMAHLNNQTFPQRRLGVQISENEWAWQCLWTRSYNKRPMSSANRCADIIKNLSWCEIYHRLRNSITMANTETAPPAAKEQSRHVADEWAVLFSRLARRTFASMMNSFCLLMNSSCLFIFASWWK